MIKNDTVRIAHIADLQLGFRKFSSAYSPEREQDFYRVWLEAVDQCIADAVQLVLIVGDVFDEPAPPVAALRVFFDGLVKLAGAGIETVVVDGNHERPKNVTQAHPLWLFEGLGAHLVYGDGPQFIRTKSGPTICAVPYSYDHPLTIEDLYEADICTVHAGCISLPGYMQGGYVWDTEWDRFFGYVALGDWHAPMVTGDTSRYAGSLERTSFGDVQTEVGYWLIEAIRGEWDSSTSRVAARGAPILSSELSATSDPPPVDTDKRLYTFSKFTYRGSSSRPMFDLALRADRESAIVTQLEELLSEHAGGADSTPLVRVTVTGCEPVNIDTIKSQYPFLKVVWRKRILRDAQRVGIGELNAATTARLWEEYCMKSLQSPRVRKLGGELLEKQL